MSVMQAPDFWWRTDPSWTARALFPLGAVYGAITARRMAKAGRRVEVPVLCVGNFVAGGAGKTPTAIALAQRLAAGGRSPAFLSRGYGGSLSRRGSGVTPVDPRRHGPADVGDEPLLLAAIAPTFVAVDRIAAAESAIAAGADCLVLDDGLQNPKLHKSVTIAVVDGAAGIGNGLCVPAGPLRAPLAQQWSAITALCIVGAGEAGERVARDATDRHIPVLRARLVPDAAAMAALRGRRIFAFAGLGRPEKFFAMLRQEGLDLSATRAFPDHHPYAPKDCQALIETAASLGASLVTTAKDKVRLAADFPASILPVTLRIDDHAALDQMLGRLF